MLNKVKLGALIGALLVIVTTFVPGIEIPEGLAAALVVVVMFFAQFFIRETEETVAKLRLKKSRALRGLGLLLLPALLFSSPVNAQEEEPGSFFDFGPAVGIGSYFTQPDALDNRFFISAAVDILKLPFLEGSTGVKLEAFFNQDAIDGLDVNYAFWSQTHVYVVENRFYTGVHVKIIQGDEQDNLALDLDELIVAGVHVYNFGERGAVIMETYVDPNVDPKEERRPVGVNVKVRF